MTLEKATLASSLGMLKKDWGKRRISLMLRRSPRASFLPFAIVIAVLTSALSLAATGEYAVYADSNSHACGSVGSSPILNASCTSDSYSSSAGAFALEGSIESQDGNPGSGNASSKGVFVIKHRVDEATTGPFNIEIDMAIDSATASYTGMLRAGRAPKGPGGEAQFVDDAIEYLDPRGEAIAFYSVTVSYKLDDQPHVLEFGRDDYGVHEVNGDLWGVLVSTRSGPEEITGPAARTLHLTYLGRGSSNGPLYTGNTFGPGIMTIEVSIQGDARLGLGANDLINTDGSLVSGSGDTGSASYAVTGAFTAVRISSP